MGRGRVGVMATRPQLLILKEAVGAMAFSDLCGLFPHPDRHGEHDTHAAAMAMAVLYREICDKLNYTDDDPESYTPANEDEAYAHELPTAPSADGSQVGAAGSSREPGRTGPGSQVFI